MQKFERRKRSGSLWFWEEPEQSYRTRYVQLGYDADTETRAYIGYITFGQVDVDRHSWVKL